MYDYNANAAPAPPLEPPAPAAFETLIGFTVVPKMGFAFFKRWTYGASCF